MEPMALGSPSNSPAPDQYLPCFLLGDNSFSQTPRRNRLSPIQDRSLAFGNIRSPSSLSSSINNETDKQKSVPTIKFGPPIIDLYDDMPTSYKLPADAFTPESLLKRENGTPSQKENNRSVYSPEFTSPMNGSMPYQFNPNVSYNSSNMVYKSPFMNNQMSASEVFNNTTNMTSPVYGGKRSYPYNDTTYQSSYDTSLISNNYSNRFGEQEFWVTIFGFMPEMHMEVINFFRNVGNFIDQYVKPDCNYLCLKYASRIEARQVLSYNGYLLKPGIIIGVTLCDNPELVGRDMTSVVNNEYENNSKLDRLRLMSQSSIRISPPVVPAKKKRKENGIVGKAIDYIMGW